MGCCECYKKTKGLLLEEANSTENASILVLCVQLPTGAKELITNTTDIKSKLDYINNAYNEDLTLKNCSDIKIIDWMVV